jgi:ATP-dependent DNA helicase RecG
MPIEIVSLGAEEVANVLGTQEGHFVDLKAIDISPASLTKPISAFANTAGGEILVGIDEQIGSTGLERAWRGFANQEAANGIVQAIEQMSPLGNHYSLEFLENENRPGLIEHITVFKSREILKATNGKAYIRRNAQKLPVEGDEALQRLRYDKGIESFEDELLEVEPQELSNSVTAIDFMLNVIPNTEPEAFLEKQRLILNKRPTVAGVLLFSDDPQAILPKRSAIKIFRYQTKEEGERDTLVFDPITIEGPIYNLRPNLHSGG